MSPFNCTNRSSVCLRPRACLKIGDVSSSEGFWAAGKQFFCRNPGGFQGKIAPSRGQKPRRLGMLTFFKQALMAGTTAQAIGLPRKVKGAEVPASLASCPRSHGGAEHSSVFPLKRHSQQPVPSKWNFSTLFLGLGCKCSPMFGRTLVAGSCGPERSTSGTPCRPALPRIHGKYQFRY